MRARPALLLAVLAVTLTAGPSGAAGGFTPKVLAGKWTGTWKNQRFGSTGPAFIVAKAPGNKKLLFTSDFGGNVFGCPNPPPEKGAITKGSGPNRWNARGFRIRRVSTAFGNLSLTYTHATRRITGSGSNPRCAQGLSWTIVGKFAGNTFTGTVNITLPDGSKAVSIVELSRGQAPYS